LFLCDLCAYKENMAAKRKIFYYLKKTILLLLMFLLTFSGYVAIITRNNTDMTIRQRVLKAIYPAVTWIGKVIGKRDKIFSNDSSITSPVSVYDLKIILNNGDSVPLSSFKGKKLMLVNTASNCGYTEQFSELEKLYRENTDRLVIIGFPSNDFKEQEKGTDEEIARFCKLNYGVSFPLAKKTSVLEGPDQNPVYDWLTKKENNGWTNKKPSWNFSKYLVNENGVLVNYFDPSISPLSKEIQEALKK